MLALAAKFLWKSLTRVSLLCRYETVNARLAATLDIERKKQIKQRFLHLRGVFSIEDFLSGWFHGAHISAIRRLNVEDFVAYGFYTQTLQDLSPEVCLRFARNISFSYCRLLWVPAPLRGRCICGYVLD